MANIAEQAVEIPLPEKITLKGDLAVPETPLGVVVFAHGSGSSRHSPRNRKVAASLQERGLATLLVDLLTAGEEQVDIRTGHLRFDVDLLASRLAEAARWTLTRPGLSPLSLAYFGASTGAAAAIIAAAEHPSTVAAIVSRGGRPDLAGTRLSLVSAPTLLLVGSRDEVVLDLNRRAQEQLAGPSRLIVVPGASHLFEEPGALETVADHAGSWLLQHLPRRGGEAG